MVLYTYGAWNASLTGVSTVSKKVVPQSLPGASYKCHAVAGRNPGGVPAAVVDVADTCSAAGRSPVRQSTETPAAGGWDAVTTATFTIAHSH